jgi:hypothetical protein
MRLIKRIAIALGILLAAALLIIISAVVIMNQKTKTLKTDISYLYTSPEYAQPVSVENVPVITQQISCGYAVIEMFSTWNGNGITEASLFNQYGKVVTSTGKSFCDEMNKQFPQYETKLYSYLHDHELIEKAYASLSKGMPVPFAWAAKLDDVWTLHYSIIVGMDIPNDRITVVNPYGYTEELTLNDFLDRTSYRAFKDIPIFYTLGFAFGFFEKNTIFIVQ